MTGTNERAELHRTIWCAANELRGSVDGWDFKQYMLGFLFYRFISENLTSYINRQEHRAGNVDFDYATISDDTVKSAVGMREEIIKDKGFFIYPSELFVNVRKNATNDQDLNLTIAKVLDAIEGSAKGTESERDMAGLFDDIDLEKAAGISHYAINKLNHGDNVTTDVLGKICKALSCTMDDIMEFVDE